MFCNILSGYKKRYISVYPVTQKSETFEIPSKFNYVSHHENLSMCICIKDHINLEHVAKSLNGLKFVGTCASYSYLALRHGPKETILKFNFDPPAPLKLVANDFDEALISCETQNFI